VNEPKDDLRVPKAGKSDVALTLARAGISAIPYLGGTAVQLLSLVIVPPLERRRAEWMNAVANRLKQLETEVKGFRLESLQKNELFVTAVLHATTAALRTHQEEKLQALQNAVVNTARGIALQESVQLMFLNAVDDLTPVHLKVLEYFDDPKKWLADRKIQFPSGRSTPSIALEKAFPNLQRTTHASIVADLFSRGMVKIDWTVVHDLMSLDAVLSPRITFFGKEFLEYIAEWRPSAETGSVYATKEDEDGKTTVQFGDGAKGARPPTSDKNVTASFRKRKG